MTNLLSMPQPDNNNAINFFSLKVYLRLGYFDAVTEISWLPLPCFYLSEHSDKFRTPSHFYLLLTVYVHVKVIPVSRDQKCGKFCRPFCVSLHLATGKNTKLYTYLSLFIYFNMLRGRINVLPDTKWSPRLPRPDYGTKNNHDWQLISLGGQRSRRRSVSSNMAAMRSCDVTRANTIVF